MIADRTIGIAGPGGDRRGVLRPLEAGDGRSLHAVFGDDAIMRWWSSGPHADAAETAAYVARNVADGTHFAIVPEGADAMGWVALIPRGSGIAEIGVILDRRLHGRGLGRAACRAAIDHAFGVKAMRRVIADVDPDNAASNRLFAGLGFSLEGRLRAQWVTHIGVRDSLIWGVLAEEWPTLSASTDRLPGSSRAR